MRRARPAGVRGRRSLAAGATSAIGGRGYPPVPWLRCATSRSPATRDRRTSTASPPGWSIDARRRRRTGRAPIDAAAAPRSTRSRDEGGGLARLWVRGGDPTVGRGRRALGLPARSASLHQLRRPLPVDEPWSLDVRPFVVGQDEDGWLEVNNRAFDWHPEQGGWTREDLAGADGRAVVRPGRVPAARGGRSAGRLLLDEGAPRRRPAARRDLRDRGRSRPPACKGLGRPLTLAGLDHLHRQGLDVGMLYVDGANAAGLALYDRLGFTVHHTDVAWTIEVAAAMTGAHALRRDPRRPRRAARRAPPLPRRPGVAGPLRAAGRARGAHRAARRRCAPSWREALPLALDVVTERTSDGGETVKWLWALRDGTQVETVLMHYADRSTVCVSSQAGCAMGCGFCATGQAGFDRHLTAGEIVEQVVRAGRRARDDGRRLSNVVFMGMGEPLANYDADVGGGRAAARRPRALGPPPHRVDGRDRARHPPAGHRGAAGEPGGVAPRRRRRAARRAGPDQPPLPAEHADGRVRRLPAGEGPAPLVRVGAHRRRQRPAAATPSGSSSGRGACRSPPT